MEASERLRKQERLAEITVVVEELYETSLKEGFGLQAILKEIVEQQTPYVQCPRFGKIHRANCQKIRKNMPEKVCDLQPCPLKDAKA